MRPTRRRHSFESVASILDADSYQPRNHISRQALFEHGRVAKQLER